MTHVAAMDERSARRIALAFPNERARLDAARARVRELLTTLRVDDRARYAVDLALEELGSNALVHGYGERAPGEMTVEVDVEPSIVRVALSDDARPFDPTSHPEPARARSLPEAPAGGRGISMVRASAAAMRYRREANRNRVEVDVARRVEP